jgi:hypothetical protein
VWRAWLATLCQLMLAAALFLSAELTEIQHPP